MALFQFLAKDNVIALVTYLSLAATVYFSLRLRHKKIRYTCLHKNSSDEYAIVFWNSCSLPIYREDLYYFFVSVNTCCTDIIRYPIDPQIPLEITYGDIIIDSFREKSLNNPTRRMNVSFDFLPTRQGCIIELNNKQYEKYYRAELKLFGRLRGENEKSVESENHLLPSKLSEVMSVIFSCIASLLTIYGAVENKVDLTSFAYFSITIAVLLMFVMGRYIYYNSMPGALSKIVKEYKKKSFTEMGLW